jgi:hypothetical protein
MAIFAASDRVALYVHLRTFESDFDKAQSQMRAISSAWTATVLAAIALLVTTGATPIAVPQGGELRPGGLIEVRTDALAYLRAVVCLVGSAGVLAFWYIDQGVYQKLLHSAFAYGLFVESEEPDLPQVRSSMFLANLDVTNRLGMFYRAQYWLFVVISVVADVTGRSIGQNPIDWNVWLIIAAHIVAAIVCELIFSHTWPSLDETIKDFYPSLAATLPTRHFNGVPQFIGPSKFDGQTDPNLPTFLRRIRHQGVGYEG